MGLSDRHYMQEPPGYSGWRFWNASTVLMIVLVICFVLQQINIVYLRTPAEFYLALSPVGLKSFFIWQLVTYMFLHGGLMHLAFNLIGLWFFGRTVENFLGKKKFLIIYFAAGICGGVLQGLLGLIFSTWFGMIPRFGDMPTFGASAGVLGLLAVFCLMEPDSSILLFFVLPVKARVILWGSLAVALFFTLVPGEPGIAHAAHLGGMLFGMAFMRLGLHREFIHFDFNFNLKWPWKTRSTKITKVNFGGPRRSAPAQPEALADQVDAILEKISQKGIQSLTAEERQILENARKKLGQ